MRIPNSWHTGWDPHRCQDRVVPQEHAVLRGKCGPEQAGTCGHISSPQIGTVALGWPLHLSWPLPHLGQSGRYPCRAFNPGLSVLWAGLVGPGKPIEEAL